MKKAEKKASESTALNLENKDGSKLIHIVGRKNDAAKAVVRMVQLKDGAQIIGVKNKESGKTNYFPVSALLTREGQKPDYLRILRGIAKTGRVFLKPRPATQAAA